MCTPRSGFNSSVAFCYIKSVSNVLNLPLWMDKKRCVIYSEKGCWLKSQIPLKMCSEFPFSPNKCIYVNLCTLLQGHRPFWGPGTWLGLRHVALHIPRKISRLTRPPIPAYSISPTESGRDTNQTTQTRTNWKVAKTPCFRDRFFTYLPLEERTSQSLVASIKCRWPWLIHSSWSS